MMQGKFHAGDRVRSVRNLSGIRRGTCGQIALVYVGASNVYDVDFDGHGLVRLVSEANLASVRTPLEAAHCERQFLKP
jgi:hypothetical protein